AGIELEGRPGGYLIALLSREELILERTWVGDRPALLEVRSRAPIEEAHAARQERVVRRGASFEPERSEDAARRGPLLETLRHVSDALIEGRLPEADRGLEALGRERLPPAFEVVSRLHRARRARLAAGLLAVAALLEAPGCAGPSPFPVVGPLPPGEARAVLERRAAAVHSLYALVRVAMDARELSGTFDVACRYERPGRLRMSAFKEVLLGSHPIFDAVFTPDGYRVELPAEGGTERRRGRLEDFPADLP